MVQLEPATFISEALNLNSVASELAEKWSVLGSTRLLVEGVLKSGTWGSASVVIRGSVDGSNWTTIATLTKVGFSPALDVVDRTYELTFHHDIILNKNGAIALNWVPATGILTGTVFFFLHRPPE